MYELVHGDGGHGGPYLTIHEAIDSALRLAVGRVSSDRAKSATECIVKYGEEFPTLTVRAERSADTGEVAISISPAAS